MKKDLAWTLLRSTVATEHVTALLVDAALIQGHRVHARGGSAGWEERRILPETDAYRLIESTWQERVQRRVTTPVCLGSAWYSIYRSHEYIQPHVDSAGQMQLLVCLRNFASGGEICLDLSSGVKTLTLGAGDALIFPAHAIEHWTSPFSEQGADGVRITIAARYFALK